MWITYGVIKFILLAYKWYLLFKVFLYFSIMEYTVTSINKFETFISKLYCTSIYSLLSFWHNWLLYHLSDLVFYYRWWIWFPLKWDICVYKNFCFRYKLGMSFLKQIIIHNYNKLHVILLYENISTLMELHGEDRHSSGIFTGCYHFF